MHIENVCMQDQHTDDLLYANVLHHTSFAEVSCAYGMMTPSFICQLGTLCHTQIVLHAENAGGKLNRGSGTSGREREIVHFPNAMLLTGLYGRQQMQPLVPPPSSSRRVDT